SSGRVSLCRLPHLFARKSVVCDRKYRGSTPRQPALNDAVPTPVQGVGPQKPACREQKQAWKKQANGDEAPRAPRCGGHRRIEPESLHQRQCNSHTECERELDREVEYGHVQAGLLAAALQA